MTTISHEQAKGGAAMAGDVLVTPEMIAAGWSIVNDGRKWPPRIGSGPGLVEVYRAMRALEPTTTHPRALEALREAGIDALASLVAAVSLLERGGKQAAPSDKMFAVMLTDYRASIERTRAALNRGEG